MTAIAIVQKASILEQLAQGKRLSDISPALGVSANAISKALKSDPEYRGAIHIGFHKRLDDAERDIECADDAVDVARARARFQSVAWRAEREFPEQWAAKQQIDVSSTVTVEHVLKFDAANLLESVRAPQHEVIDVPASDYVKSDDA